MASSSSAKPSPKKQKFEHIASSSWSHVDCEPDTKFEKIQHVCTIGGFSKKMEMEPGTTIHSGDFTIKMDNQSTKWRFWIRPNGNDDENKGQIGLYLDKVNGTTIKTNYTFSFIDKHGRQKGSKSFENNFGVGSHTWGYKNFMSHSEAKKILHKDTLTILCEIKIIGDEGKVIAVSTDSQFLREEMKNTHCTVDMIELFESGKFSDVTIVCEDREGGVEEFKCHKAILAARSTVFDAMFSHDMKENRDNEVVIKDMGAKTFRDMASFIYGGRIYLEDYSETAKLLVAGEKYNLKQLKEKCEDHISECLSVTNVLDMLVLADLHRAATLRSTALEFFCENRKEILAQEGWREKVKMYPDLMADIIDAI